MARVNLWQLGNAFDDFGSADLATQMTLVAGAVMWLWVLKLINKWMAKTWYRFWGLYIYIVAMVLGFVVPGALQANFPQYDLYIKLWVITLWTLSLIWIIYDFFKDQNPKVYQEEASN